MEARVLALAVGVSLALTACSQSDTMREQSIPDAVEEVSTEIPDRFVNRVWMVTESSGVAPGSLRVFLSDGTLVMADPHSTPAFGTWRVRDGELAITEEGLTYAVDVIELSEDVFRIRIHNPGPPTEIRFGPAVRAARNGPVDDSPP